MVRLGALLPGVGGGMGGLRRAPSGIDWCFPEVRGQGQTSCLASPGPGVVPHLNPRPGTLHSIDDLWRRPSGLASPGSTAPALFFVGFSSAALSVNTLKIAFRFEFPTSPVIFWPPLISASRIEILSPGLHEELVKQKKQEINVPASRLHTALDGIKVE